MNTPKPLPPYSKTRETDSLVFTAGHIGRSAGGQMSSGLHAQTTLALQNLEDSLQSHGLTRANVVRTTVYLADMAHWEEMNEPYRTFFDEPFPARSTISVGLPANVLIEIDAIASKAAVQ